MTTYTQYENYIAQLMKKAESESFFDSAVEDSDSEVVKQLVETSDGTKITIENKTNNPKWRGENAETTGDNSEVTKLSDGTSPSVFDQYDAEDERLFNAPMGDWNDTAEMEIQRQEKEDPSFFDVNDLDSWEATKVSEKPTENETDYWGNKLTGPFGLASYTWEERNAMNDAAMQRSLPDDMKDNTDPYKYEYKNEEEKAYSNFISKYIVNPKTEEEKASNTALLKENGRGGTKEALKEAFKTNDPIINTARNAVIEVADFLTPDAEFIKSGYDFILDSEFRESVTNFVAENPGTSALAAYLMFLSRGKIKKLPDKIQKQVNKRFNTKNGRKELQNTTDAANKAAKKASEAVKAQKLRVEKLKKINEKAKNQKVGSSTRTKAQQELNAARAELKALEKTSTTASSTASSANNILKQYLNKPAFPTISTTGTALGGLAAWETFGDPWGTDEDSKNISAAEEDGSTFKDESTFEDATKSSFTDALNRLNKDKDSSTIANAVQNDSNVARMVLDNQRRIQDEYGMDLARDLFTVAVGALAGFNPMEMMGAKGDKLILDQAHDRAMEIQGFKDSQAMAREQAKLDAKTQKEKATTRQANRDSTESKMMDIIKQGGKSGGNLDSLSSEVLGALMKADELRIDYSDKGVQRALVKATQQAVGKGGWFDSEDEESARANITGHFLGNMAILSTQEGSLSKDGYALKNATAENNAAYTNWLFSKHSKTEIKAVSTAKLNEWKEIRKTKGEQWIWYNNFTGWAAQNLRQTGQM